MFSTNDPQKKFWIGVLLSVFAAFCFGVAPLFAKTLYNDDVDTLTFLALTRVILIAGIGSIVLIKTGRFNIAPHAIRPSIILGIFFLVFSYMHFTAISGMDVGLVTVIVFLYPLVLAALVRIWDRQILSARFIIGLLTALLGLAFALMPNNAVQLNIVSSAQAFAAALFIAGYLFLSNRLLQTHDPLVSSVSISIVPALVFLSLASYFGWHFPSDFGGWVILIGCGILITAGQMAFFYAIQMITAVRVSLVLKLEPVITILGAVIFLHESLNIVQYLGIALVIASIFATSQNK